MKLKNYFNFSGNRKSFTLVELLVVIAVIGLLASLIIVNLTGTRSKANIARGLQFSQSVHHALGSEAVGVWSFDEGSGATAYDASGYGNNGTLVNGPGWRCAGTDSNYTPSGQGCSLQFDGANDRVAIGIGNNYFPMPLFTICVWAKSPGLAPGMTRNGIVAITYGLNLAMDASGRFRTTMSNGSNVITVVAPGNLYDNRFHHLCLTFDGEKRHMYVDGILKVSATTVWAGTTNWPTNDCNIGRDNNDVYYYFNGLIDEVRIYKEVLTAGRIEQLYAAGATEKDLAMK